MFPTHQPTPFPLSALSFGGQKKATKRMPLLSGLLEPVKVCLWAFLVSFSIHAQKTTPKIGLVLSGGGAKGLAHIGVLKELEKNNIKIDYIAGTSMGAIIGGLYASGYNAHQLDSIFSQVDADALLQDYTPRDAQNFTEKRNDELYALTLPFSKFKIGIPAALSKGLYNYNLLSKLTHHVRHVRDFSKLPIPFACIATNVETGQEVVLNKGILAQAILASGAFPSLYQPVEINGELLIDGGVVNNYPIEELQKMGAAIIIGVDVQDGLKKRENLSGATGVLVQITNYDMVKKMTAKKEATHIYIKPDIQGYSVISFDQGKEIIQKGVEAAQKQALALQKIANNASTTLASFVPLPSDSLYIAKVVTPKLANYNRRYLLGKLNIKNQKAITYESLFKGISNLNATQNFNTISYSFSPNNLADELVLNIQENPNHQFLKLGLHYDGLYKSAILLNYTHKKLLTKNDLFSLDIGLGDYFRYQAHYSIDNGFFWSFGLRSQSFQFSKNIATSFAAQDSNSSSINVDYNDISNTLYFQTIFKHKFLLGAGVEHKYLTIVSPTLATTNQVLEKSSYVSLLGYLKYDSFDKKYFPTSGWFFSGEFKSFLYSTNFTQQFSKYSIAKADIAWVFSPISKLSVKLQSEGGFSIADKTVPFNNFVLGGYGFASYTNFRPFYGYDFLSLSGDSYVKGSATIDYEIFKKSHINFTANYSNIGNNIFESDQWISKPMYNGYGIGYGLETLLGPIEIKHSWSPDTHKSYTWISAGFWF